MRLANLELDPEALHPSRPPVVLLGRFTLIRALGLARIPVIVATCDPDDPVLSSRYVCGHCLLPGSAAEPRAAVDALLRAGEALTAIVGARVPLMYGSDDWLGRIDEFADELAAPFLFLANDPDLGLALLDKERFATLARARGLHIPRTLRWAEDGDDAVAAADFPLVVKPRTKAEWGRTDLSRTLFGSTAKALLFSSGADLLAHPEIGRFRAELTVQEYIEGSEAEVFSFHGFADETGALLASYSGRKIRTFPERGGESSFLELVHDEALVRAGTIVAERLGLRGVFKLDFKRRVRTGEFFLLEVNARWSLWSYLGAANGVNLLQVAYDYLLHGTRPRSSEYGTRTKWIDLGLDFRAYRERRRRGEMSLGRWLRSILLARKVHHVFSWRDPEPALRSGARAVAGWVRARVAGRDPGHARAARSASAVAASARDWQAPPAHDPSLEGAHASRPTGP